MRQDISSETVSSQFPEVNDADIRKEDCLLAGGDSEPLTTTRSEAWAWRHRATSVISCCS